MTVLAKYQRLEAEGLWRPEPEAQRRDVIVSIGKATLTLSAANGTALTHWSLPAILRDNPGKSPAVYRPGEDAPETLEVSDPAMVGAIEEVLRAIRRGTARPGRLRGLMVFGGLAALVALMLIWLPGAITRYTAKLVPAAARETIGAELLDEVRRVAGTPCSAPAGLRALSKLEERLFPGGATRLYVLPSALAETQHLPGGTILLGRGPIEDFDAPEVLAGYLLAEDVRRSARDPMERLLSEAGLGASLALLTRGHLPEGMLARLAERLVSASPAPVPSADLIRRMAKAQVPTAAYAFAQDISGESTRVLAQAKAEGTVPVLGDSDWIALQRICEE